MKRFLTALYQIVIRAADRGDGLSGFMEILEFMKEVGIGFVVAIKAAFVSAVLASEGTGAFCDLSGFDGPAVKLFFKGFPLSTLHVGHVFRGKVLHYLHYGPSAKEVNV